MKVILSFVLIILFSIGQLFGADYFRLNYKIGEDENFAEILKTFVKDNSIINTKTPLVLKTIKRNPQIKDWYNLTAGEEIQLYIDSAHLDLNKYKNYEASILSKIIDSKTKVEKNAFVSEKNFKSSLFYLPSTGLFEQQNGSTAKVTFNQNSYLTFGSSLVYYHKESLISTNMGLYISTFNDTTSSLSTVKTPISPEIGANLYEDFRLIKYGLTVYGGVDYEIFSTFDLAALSESSQVKIIRNNVGYLTLGTSKSFTLLNKVLFTKLSMSQSLLSSNSANTTTYNGNKFLFYLNYKFSDKFFVNSLIKYHLMKGPDNLSSLRVGIGVGYILF